MYGCRSYTLSVTVREGGRSSIPEAAVLDRRSRGVLDAPPSRSMTAEGLARPSPPSAGLLRERLHFLVEIRLALEPDAGEVRHGDVAVLDADAVGEAAVGLEQVGI